MCVHGFPARVKGAMIHVQPFPKKKCGEVVHKEGAIHTAWEWDRDWYRDQLESIVLCRNVHRDSDRDREQDPLFSIVPVPFLLLIPIPFPCSVN